MGRERKKKEPEVEKTKTIPSSLLPSICQESAASKPQHGIRVYLKLFCVFMETDCVFPVFSLRTVMNSLFYKGTIEEKYI